MDKGGEGVKNPENFADVLYVWPLTSVQPLFLGDLQWQPWQAWSHCDKTCGEGQRKRRRACFPPKNGGKECPEAGDPAYEEDGKCSEGPCSSKCTYSSI